jgi:hypothetical protein
VPEKEDRNIAAAMAQVQGTTANGSSLTDRLAALRSKQG